MLSISLSSSGPFCGIRHSNFRVSKTRMAKPIRSCPQLLAAKVDNFSKASRYANLQNMGAKGSKERIREQLLQVEVSDSAYDTAWVAMVPSQGSPEVPCFPQCLDWILRNQHTDGSWGLAHFHPSLVKDALSSTLACVLALKRWNVGEEHVRRGLDYIRSNFSCTADEHLPSPIGFEIIFPGMLGFAIDMGLDLGISQVAIDGVLFLRDLQLERASRSTSEAEKAYKAYIAEGLGKSQDWNAIMKYQRKNGSLFNSPSTTAAASIYLHDAKAFEYLHAVLQKFGSSVPSIYPLEMHTHLSMIDTLEKLGIARHFTHEIKSILDRTYRCWLQDDEEIKSDMRTSAMAFRLLRMNGYDVSSDVLSHLGEEENFYNSVQGYLKDLNTVVELYKASQIKISPTEHVLDKLNSWSSSLLETELSTSSNQGSQDTLQEVDYALKFPSYANFPRVEHKRNIEHFNIENAHLLKTSYTFCSVNNDLLELAVEDFSSCQSIYRKELELLLNWVKESKLDQLQFARQKQAYSYLSIASMLFSPEMADARISWTKNTVLVTVIDDFFDVVSSREEAESLYALVEKWDGNHGKEFYSERVKIIFYALYNTINEIEAKAFDIQKRPVAHHFVELWLKMLRAMMNEADWSRNKSVPPLEEYMTNGCLSFGIGPLILSAVCFVGPKLSEEVFRDSEYNDLFMLTGTCGRLLNDIQTFERETNQEGTLNGVLLHVLHSGDSISTEEAKKEMLNKVDSSRSELLKLVLREGSVVPRPFKDIFWNTSRMIHAFYIKSDKFTSPTELISLVNAVVHEPLDVNHLVSDTSIIQ